MCVKPEMGRRFTFSNILVVRALYAVAQIDTVLAFAIQEVPDIKFFASSVAPESVRRGDLAATFIPGCGQAGSTTLQFRRFFWDYLLSPGDVGLAYQVSQILVTPVGQNWTFFEERGEFRVGAKDLPVTVYDFAYGREPPVKRG